MSLRIGIVTTDTTNSQKLALWWAEQLEGTVEAYGEVGQSADPHSADAEGAFFIVRTPQGLGLGFQQVTDPTPGKNRLHLDFSAPNRTAEVARLASNGATIYAEYEFWTTLSDPDGNLFCVSDLA